MKFRLAAMLLIVFIPSKMAYCIAGDSAPYRGFPTQEEAAEAFLQSVAAGDFTGALSVFDCGQAANTLTFSNYTTWLGSIFPVNVTPTEHAAFMELNHIFRRHTAAMSFQGFILNLLLPEKYNELRSDMPMRIPKAERLQVAEEITRYLNPERLEGLKLLHLDTAISFINKEDDDGLIARLSADKQKRIDVDGYMDDADCVMYFSWNGGVYVCGVLFTQYDDGWHIRTLTCYNGGLRNGQIKKLNATVDEFERAVEADLIHLLPK